MKVYIAFNHGGKPIGVLMSESQEKAEIAWAGMGVKFHSIEEIDPKSKYLDTSIAPDITYEYKITPLNGKKQQNLVIQIIY